MIASRKTGSWAVAFLLVLVSCEMFDDTVIDPFESQNRHFTIYGFLDVTADFHKVRVIPVKRTPENIRSSTDPDAMIDAEVVTTDLATGYRVIWRHKLSPLTDGTFAHIFTASFRIEEGHPYRIDVTRSDSARSSAVTVVPSLSTSVEPMVDEPVVFQSDVFQRVHLRGVPKAVDISVLYNVSDGGVTLPNGAWIEIPYGSSGTTDSEGQWTFDIDLARDATTVLRSVPGEVPPSISLEKMGVRARWIDEQWTTFTGPVNFDRISQPGILSNVENGDGFFGSVGTYTRFWTIDDPEILTMLGFVVRQ